MKLSAYFGFRKKFKEEVLVKWLREVVKRKEVVNPEEVVRKKGKN